MNNLNTVLHQLAQVTGYTPQRSGDEYLACCPVHEADGQSHTPSLSVRAGDKQAVLMNCHAGCDYRDIVIALDLDGKPRAKSNVLAEYDYRDEHGHLLFQKVRLEPKSFRFRHISPQDEWVWKKPVLESYPLYRLPELNRMGAIYIAEGEKDVNRLHSLGLCATCNMEGASEPGKRSKWRKEYTAQLAGAARVILLPDNDPPGRAHMQHIAQQLQGKVGEVRIVELPGLPEKGDVSDWLNQGHTTEELLALVEQAPALGQEADPAVADPPVVKESPPADEAGDTSTPKLKKTLGQIVAILSAPPWSGVIGFNGFRQTMEKRTATPYGGEAGAWRDCDTAETMLYLEKTTSVAFGRDLVDLAVMTVAHRHEFNPAQDRLRALAAQWDGQARLQTWLTEYLSAKTNDGNREYLEEIGAAWLKGVCARVLFPGCKRDDVLVLRGPQGWRKSTAANAMADVIHPDSFTDSVDLNNLAEAKIQIRGVVIAELSELAGMGRAEVEGVKAFIATKQDHFREKFGRYAEDFPRTVSFIGSTNDPNFLKDPTGNRRWWPVTLERPVDIPRLEAVLPQLIGEAARRVMRGSGGYGEPWHVTAEKALEQAERVREAHFDEDVWTDHVLQILRNMTAAGTFITTAGILDDLQIPRAQQTDGPKKRVVGILRNAGYEEKRRWLDKGRTAKERHWIFSNTRDVGTGGYMGTASKEADKTCTHDVPASKNDVGTKPDLAPAVPTLNDDVGTTQVQGLASQEADVPMYPPVPTSLYVGKNFPDAQTDAAALVHGLKNGYRGFGRAALMEAFGWDDPRWQAAIEQAHGLIEVRDGRWYAREERP